MPGPGAMGGPMAMPPFGPHGRMPHGMRGMMRGPDHRPQMAEKGFDLRLEGDRRLRVSCGDEPMAACVEAVRPLLDRLGAAGE
jgi:hypothetical protein